MRVLVIEDEEPIREALCAALSAAGHHPVPAPGGEAALHAFSQAAPDLVILDLLMPGMSGVETLRRMREAGYAGPAFVLTGMGKGARTLLEEAAALGAVRHIRKPFKLAEVLAAVEEEAGRSGVCEGASADVPGAGAAGGVSVDARALVAVMPTPACLTDEQGRILAASAAFRRLAGEQVRRLAQVEGERGGLPDVPLEVVEEALAEGRLWFVSLDSAAGRQTQLRVVTVSEGLLLWMLTRQRLEAALDSSRRLESLVQLAGGIAHELNNPLGGISAQAQLLRDKLTGAAPEALLHLDRIEAETARAAAVVEGLLLFAGQVGLSREHVDVGALLERVLGSLGAAPERVALDVEEGLPEVFWDAGKVARAMTAVVDNAFRASGEGGRIWVGARRAGGGMIRLFVRDEGPGIPEDALERVVEPFYTTRPVGEGRGLGLSIAWGVAAAHGGRLSVSSGAGTLVTMDLPVEGSLEGGA